MSWNRPCSTQFGHVDDVGGEQVGQAVRAGGGADLGDVVVVGHDGELDLVLVADSLYASTSRLACFSRGARVQSVSVDAVVDALGAGVRRGCSRVSPSRGARGQADQQAPATSDAAMPVAPACGDPHGALLVLVVERAPCEPGCCGTRGARSDCESLRNAFRHVTLGHSGYVKSTESGKVSATEEWVSDGACRSARAAAGRATLTDVARSPASPSRPPRRRSTAATRSRPPPGSACSRPPSSSRSRPNPLARSLLAGRTGTVGLLTSDLEGRFVIPILMGAEDAFGAGQVNVFLCDARGDAIREQHHLKALLSRRVDGIIVVGRQTDPRPSLGHDIPVPGRLRVRAVRRPLRPVAHPRQRGRRPARRRAPARLRPAPASRTSPATPPTPPRRTAPTACAAALARRRARARRRRHVLEWSERWGRDAAACCSPQHPDIDAILCGSDQIARGVLDTAATSAAACPTTSRSWGSTTGRC